MAKRLIGKSLNSNVVAVDADCPECDSTNVRTSECDEIDSSELEARSVWCGRCGYGWFL